MRDATNRPTVSLIGRFVFLLGCISPNTRDIGIYRINATQLAEELQKLAFNDTRNVADLLGPGLPTYWHWGMSGRPTPCDLVLLTLCSDLLVM
jgi:hypothetical protein